MNENDISVRFMGFNGKPMDLLFEWDSGGHHNLILTDKEGKQVSMLHVSGELIHVFPTKAKPVFVSLVTDFIGTDGGKEEKPPEEE